LKQNSNTQEVLGMSSEIKESKKSTTFDYGSEEEEEDIVGD